MFGPLTELETRTVLNEKIFHNKIERKQIKVFIFEVFGEQHMHNSKQPSIDGRCRFTRILRNERVLGSRTNRKILLQTRKECIMLFVNIMIIGSIILVVAS